MGQSIRRAAIAAMVVAHTAGAACAGSLTGVLQLLQPGTRPALGVGGDPFSSPLEDRYGWWAAHGLGGRAGSRLNADAETPVPGTGSMHSRSLDWNATGGVRRLGRDFGASIRARNHDWGGGFSAKTGDVRLEASGGQVEFGTRVSRVLPGLTIQAVGPVWSDGGLSARSSVGGGARYAPSRWVAAQLYAERIRTSQHFASDLYQEPILASADMQLRHWQADTRLSPIGTLQIEGSRSHTLVHSTASPAFKADYELVPDGTLESEQASIAWSMRPDMRVVARWTRSAAHLGGEARVDGDVFGWVSYADAETRAWLLGLDHLGSSGQRTLLDGEVVTAGGAARGTVESWPFTPATVDLLGLREIGRATGTARWYRLHAAWESRVDRTASGAAGITWFDLTAHGHLDSWRPAFLVFGQTDFQRNALTWNRAQLAIASLALRVRRGRTSAALEVQQPTFWRAHRAAASPGSASGSGHSRSNSQPSTAVRGAGTLVRLSVTRSL